jgi:DDE superfamily endonuclease
VPTQKKPRGKKLTPEEKEQNRKVSQVRVRVEHSLAGVKRSRSVKDVLRNTKESFSDLAMVAACSLHNLRVKCRKKQSNKL